MQRRRSVQSYQGKKLVRVAGYDLEGRRRVVCYGEDEAGVMLLAQEEAEAYVKLQPVSQPVSSWSFRVE